MKKQWILIPLMGIAISGCGIRETMQSLEYNRSAIDASTYAIEQNVQAIEASNREIEQNTRQLEEINRTLKKAGAL